MRRSFGAALVRLLRRFVPSNLTNRYRPERHYMRGPGPKSRGRELGLDGKGMAASLGNGGKSPGS